MPSKTTVRFISLGCPKNLVDSEVMAGQFINERFTVVPSDSASDVAVVNTCGFIEAAKQESIDTLLAIAGEKKKGNLKLLVAAGCLTQRYSKELPALLPEVDAFIGTGDFSRLALVIHNKLGGDRKRNFVEYPKDLPAAVTPRVYATPAYSRYVKIAEGCSHSCSFCIIPKMRGPLNSRPLDDVVEEIRRGCDEGVREFNLISQDLNEYGRDRRPAPMGSVAGAGGQAGAIEGTSLFSLLTKIADLPGDFWVRLLYMYPLQFPDRLIELIRDHPHLCKYVDIPLQHIDDAILKSMRRGSSSRYIYRLINRLKEKIPGIILRTTFITGYPGESDGAFEKLVQFVKETEFDRLGVFAYSDEEGTPAFDLKAQVPKKIREERRDYLMEVQQKISLKKNRAYVGRTLRALYEGPSDQNEYPGSGRFYGQAPEIDGEILTRKRKAAPGDFVDVKITDAFEYDLLGEIVNS
ncbi:MAG: 30S ribosomal protein S12 methylthiotransferase RimO [Deltaproteobacteria bacterium]|nr:30S ribosomal protein S12 methylthiotransferase RimO [Deltaproteobacteria bacterium]